MIYIYIYICMYLLHGCKSLYAFSQSVWLPAPGHIACMHRLCVSFNVTIGLF